MENQKKHEKAIVNVKAKKKNFMNGRLDLQKI